MKKNIVSTVVAATGLPTSPVEKELMSLIAQNKKSADDLSLDELREIMADYLQTVFLELAEESTIT
jgi:hypothetical protein